MLALSVEQGRRGGAKVDRLQNGAAVGRPGRQSPEQGWNIRERISQWEGRSKDVATKVNPLNVAQIPSEDVLRDGCSNKGTTGGLHLKDLSKAQSLDLDFRESQAQTRNGRIGKTSEPLQKCNTKDLTSTPGNKPMLPFLDSNTDKITVDGELKPDSISDGDVVSKHLPLVANDNEDNMPAGNFYTSRGFWRNLEEDRFLWEKGARSLGEAPPKPQRTFKYQGAKKDAVPRSSRSTHTNQPSGRGRRGAHPPSFPPPPCPVARTNGLSRHKNNRRSFEYEDALHPTVKQGTLGSQARHSGLHHAYSDDNIYEDIVCEVTRDNPYEDVKLVPMCLPIARLHGTKLHTKPQPIKGGSGKDVRKTMPPLRATTADTAKPATPRRISDYKMQKTPQYVNKIETIFDDKRGRKRVKNQGFPVRGETSGTESDPEDNGKGLRRSVRRRSTLKRRSGYRTLEKDLIQAQQQQLFQIFVVVSLRKGSPANTYSPEITQQFPKMFEKSSRLSKEAEDQLKVIPKFCFPDIRDWKPSAHTPSETFSFVLTGEDGSRWFCYCRKILPSGKGKRLPEVHCVVSKLGCFNLFAKILEEVERRREISPALVYPFMRSVMEAPFPAPGRTVMVKSFLPGSGNEVLTLCRPVDSRLEHVDFDTLLQCLSVGKLLKVFASLLLERRVIFVAEKLSALSRCGHAALALLYPFTWQHTFVPVLPTSMLDISCSPTPFLIGVLAPSLPQVLELPIEEVLIVDLCADEIVTQLGDEDCILPSKLQAALQQILEEREDILERDDGDGDDDDAASEGQPVDLRSLVSEAFVRFFVELVGHYPLHMVESSSGSRELHRDNFRKSHPSRGVRQFLQLFMESQMFAGFIQDKELRKGGGRGLFEVRVAEYLDSSPDPEPSGVNKFLKGLGNKMKLLQMK
ncbi:DENN domain-containing protein 2C isoform X1 [Phyllopteryx taeniolatus]|uniref:DENN domain-containing protein 2C isoform X1 n=1 Tax=Phyllopteryx taeniolatus TaxID=161469 RepID=UPI002AD4E713|nr:DENN domain-containing protein 2C isoform X1 [Phyllopteryx taeniolatus]XP_061623375.1 DENN domain-containing protein 2C isoform X1 [Phyllopteryx taeniolatus]XP_061623381.1 DENN domain-containing protein 2C isoform X1 [Phyllopteryx taeniolatus]